jgi:anti-sigma regulatory factor (Ser/Thr protein kinase)
VSVTHPRPGFRHEAAFYDGDDSFLAAVLPFLRAGQDAGEPMVVAVDPHKSELIYSALDDSAGVEFLSGGAGYRLPADTVRDLLDRFTRHVSVTDARLRVVGEALDPALAPVSWEPWVRYEAAVNELFRDFPVSGLCPVDATRLPAEVLSDVTQTHPTITPVNGPRADNPAYQDPAAFLAQRGPRPADPLEASPPTFRISDPTPQAAQEAVRSAAEVTHLDPLTASDLELAVNEVLTNAWGYGREPITLCGWAAPERLLITVQDSGPGPADPYAGLRPVANGSGLGLWIAHKLCAHVEHSLDAAGFTVRLSTSTDTAPRSPR